MQGFRMSATLVWQDPLTERTDKHMKRNESLVNTSDPKTMVGGFSRCTAGDSGQPAGGVCSPHAPAWLCFRATCAVRLLPILLLMALPAAVLSQDYTYTTNNSKITITGYIGSGGAVTIPSTINGLPVASIGNGAFLDRTSVTSVTIPSSVTSIGDEAFSGCTGLTSVTIPTSVTILGIVTFYGCTGLTSVTIPSSVTSIGVGTFYGCTGLTSVTIPNSVTSLGDEAFYGCTGLASVTIPTSVTSLGIGAFAFCSSLASITIPNGVTSIGSGAFAYCGSLASATIPNSVTSLGEVAFYGCGSLTAITVGALNPAYSSVGGVLFNHSQTTLIQYPAVKAGSNYTIPGSVTRIGVGSFYGGTGLTSVMIPDSVTSIGDHAFYGCTGLASVTIPDGVTSIESYTFFGCSSLTGAYFKGNAPSVGSQVFDGDDNATVYYLQGTTGWGPTFGGRPTALWDPQITYTIVTSASPSAGGTTSGGGDHDNGSSVTVTATANACYSFVNWTEGGTPVSSSASYTFTASANRTLVANFSQINYTISTSASPSAGGTTSGDGSKTCGSSVTVMATANACYNFVNWTEGGTPVSSSASYTFTASANRTLVANFSQINYTISTSSSPAEGGTTSGGGSKTCGSSVTVTATANACYNFVNWTEGGTPVSSSASYTFTASANRTLVANFSQISNIIISTSASPSAGGTTSGDGSKTCGSSVTVTATPNACYNFVNWTEGGTPVSSSASYTFTAIANRTLVANFSQINYTISTSASPSAGGTTSGGGSKSCGSSVTVTATPNACYSFVNWTEGGTPVSSSASYTFTASANRTLVANFSQFSYTISTSASPSAGGTTSGGGSKTCGSSVTVMATPNACYNFVNWTEGGTPVSSSASYTFTASANRTLVANFSQISYTISTSASPSAGGTTGGGGSKSCGSSVTVMATPNACYTFVNWTEGGTPVSSSASYTFTASGNRILVANFSQFNYTISTSASPAEGGTTGGGGSMTCGSSVTVTASANACYSFVSWMEGGMVVSTDDSYTFTASGNRTLVANFSQISYMINTSSSPAEGGTTSGGVNMTCGSSVTVTAMPNTGHSFMNWAEGETVVADAASYTFTVSGDRTLVAHFTAELQPQLGVSVTELVTIVFQGQNASPDSVAVWNAGDGTLNYTINSDAAWLAVDPSSGTSSGTTNLHTVSYGTASLSSDIYDATITVSDPRAVNSPQTIGVTLYVADEFDESTKEVSLKMKVNFKPGELDSASLKAVISLPDGVSLNNSAARLSIGGVVVPFTLDSVGSGKNGLNSLKLQSKGRSSSSNQLWRVTAKFKGDFDAVWAEDGLINATTSAPIQVPVLLWLDTDPTGLFYIEKQLLYKATMDKAGSAK